jgi:hypothetical protein
MVPLVVLADNIVNDVTAGGNDTFYAGGSTTIAYWVVANNGDGQSGCNASDGSAAIVTINTPVAVTATPSSLTFTACGTANNQSVVFTSGTPGDYLITVTVSDTGTGSYNTNPGRFTLHVLAAPNTPPTVDAGGPYSGDEGSAIAISGTASDPDGDPLTYLWSYSVVTADSGATCSFADATALSTTVTCSDDGAFTVTLTATGDPAGPVNDTAGLTVANVAPMVTLSGPDAADEGETKSYSFATSDPGANDTFTGSASCGASGAVQNFTIDNASGDGSFDCVFVDDNPTGTPSDTSTVAVTVTDDDGSSDSASIDVTVSNVAPVVTAFACPADPVAVNTPVTLAGAFTDVGTADTHTASIAWGDSSSSAATVAQGSGSGTVSGSHTYSSAGIYTPQLTIADDDTGSASADCQYVVVYDPSAGFVTGGGWITSPAGAYMADPALTGRANFGFVSKYKRGQSVPDGQTQFQFQAGNLNFHSTAYQWLVVSGAKATYKGWGAINGSGNYGFLLSAIDGQRTGGGGIDKFRIKIWDVASSAVVYDNNLGGGDDADPATALGGGSIVIHSR